MPISLVNSQPRRVPTGLLRRAARSILSSERAAKAEASILLTDDATTHEMNLRYRGHHKPTDVLSFAQRDAHRMVTAHESRETLGDIVISVQTAARQADSFGVTVEAELALLAVHGILHLVGYDDETDEGADEMRVKET